MEILGIDYYWIWLELAVGIGLTVWGIRLAMRDSQDDIHDDSDTVTYPVTGGLTTSITGIFISTLVIIREAFEFTSSFTAVCAGLLVLSVIFLLVASGRIKKKIKSKYKGLPDSTKSSLKQLENDISRKKKELLRY